MNEYQEQILDHYHNPRNFGYPTWTTTSTSFMENISCGDEITVFILITNKTISDIRFKGNGCSICIATASLLSEEFKNKTTEFIKEFKIENVLEVLGISLTTSRIKCASLPLLSFKKAVIS